MWLITKTNHKFLDKLCSSTAYPEINGFVEKFGIFFVINYFIRRQFKDVVLLKL